MVRSSESLRAYVPEFLMSRFLARQEPLDGPGMERFPAAVLFADISGFTPLADRLAQRGPAGEVMALRVGGIDRRWQLLLSGAPWSR
jgi:class 3 adenylate cyclase